MITTIKNDNSILYKDLFQKASEVLSGYERTQTFDEIAEYYYKDSETKSFILFNYSNGPETSKEEKLYEFANALTQYGYLYVKNGKDPLEYNFVPELGITTLEEYYNWLPELKKDAEGKPTVFTKLPLDEAHFEINPNTRAIAIPADFKKNGVAVQGDDLAEVVYFMIDRYFDAMDLNNTEIYIEWETPKGKDGTVTKSVSETYLKMIDDENYPGKLIFGWAISDAITKDSGTLKFSVRFVQWNDEKKKIVYSFNTLTAQVTIHPNLGLDLENDEYDIDNCNDRLLDRIMHSEVVGGIKAAIPYFLQNLVILEDGYDIEDNHTTGTYDLSVVAAANDTGVVSYVWKRAGLDENNVCDDIWVEKTGNLSMNELTEDELEDMNYNLLQDHVYHLDNGDGSYQLLPKAYYNLKDTNTLHWFETKFNLEEEIPAIYEQRSTLTVEEYGMYKVEARNRIFNSLTAKDSNVVIFKRPESIVMDNTNQTVDKHIIGEDSAKLSPVIIEEVGDLEYQWYKDSEAIDSLEAKELEYEVTDPGMYKLSVIRTRNRATTEGESIEYRVTNAPAIPEFTEDTYNGQMIFTVQGLENGRESMEVSWKDVESDEFFVSWFLYRGDQDLNGEKLDDIEIVTFKIVDDYTSTFNPTENEYFKILEAENENIEGRYYAIVKNKLNGVESEYNNKPVPEKMFIVTGA